MGNLNQILFYLLVGLTIAFIGVEAASLIRQRWQRLTQNFFKRLLITLLMTAALLLLAFSVLDPAETKPPADVQPYHLVVVVDVSDSVMRDPQGWERVRQRVLPILQNGLRDLPANIDPNSPASILSFRGNVAESSTTLRELAGAFARYESSSFASGAGTDIGMALDRATQLITETVKRGEILLVTDGNDTIGKAYTAAEHTSASGIPITIIPVESGIPDLALASINLAGQVKTFQETVLRGVLANQRNIDASVTLTIDRNLGLESTTDTTFGSSLQSTGQLNLKAGNTGKLRQSMAFEGVGIQYVDVRLTDPSNGNVLHQQRLFTQVVRPLQILALGDNRWSTAFPPEIAVVTPQEISTFTGETDLSKYDAFVISGIPATSIQPAALQNLAHAVEFDGLGFMLINGDHGGADEQAETVLRSYHKTVIDPLLPVDTDPRPVPEEPPPRQVVIFIDTSGSMGGWRLDKAKQIANYLVDTFMRPQDILDVVAFTTDAAHPVEHMQMDAAGRVFAQNAINSLQVGGGTDPTAALRMMQRQIGTNCGLIFLSDGEFGADIASVRPDCRAAAFQINESPGSNAISQIADPFNVPNASFNPASIKIPFFQPEERKKFFENGEFQPFSMSPVGGEALLVPHLNMQGAAISYMRDNADLVAIRPRFIDPLLAYRQTGKGITGVITTAIPENWTVFPEGREAVQQWILRTIGYYDRDRYSFSITDTGSRLNIKIELHNKDGTLPKVDSLNVTLELNGVSYAIDLDDVAESPATFQGTIDVPRTANAQPATLIISENGEGALPRAQHIPMLIPPAATLNTTAAVEASTYGLNTALLEQMSEISGGTYNPNNDYRFFQSTSARTDTQHWWRILLPIAALCYLGAIMLRKLGG